MVSLLLTWGGGYPANCGEFIVKTGTLFLTNQRVIYLPTPPQAHFVSLSVPILHVKNGQIHQPWYGANYFQALVVPVAGGGIPLPAELKLTFNHGGVFEFSTMLQGLTDRIIETGEIPVTHEPLPAYSPPTAQVGGRNNPEGIGQGGEEPPPYPGGRFN